MRGSTRPTMELEKRGNGEGVLAGAFQRVGGHNPEGPGKIGERGQVSRTDKFAQGKFCVPINPKDGDVVAGCEDPRERRILELVVLILHLEKPTQITMTLSNTIFGAFSGIRKVS